MVISLRRGQSRFSQKFWLFGSFWLVSQRQDPELAPNRDLGIGMFGMRKMTDPLGSGLSSVRSGITDFLIAWQGLSHPHKTGRCATQPHSNSLTRPLLRCKPAPGWGLFPTEGSLSCSNQPGRQSNKGCMWVEGQRIEMPSFDGDDPDKFFIKFKNHYKKLKAPFVIYADFECLTTRTGTVSTKEMKTDKYQHHRPCGFMINVVNSIDNSNEPFLYRGEDCMDIFVKKMIEVKDKIMDKMKENKDIIMRVDDRRDFKTATKCFICGQDFKEGDKKCRDHCHFTGRYRGCAHDDCNLQFSMRYYKIPVFLHNLKNYDSHLIIERANELSERAKIDVIALNSEKFITFAFKNLCFKDSFSFLSSSLDKLVKLSKYEDGEKKQNWQNNFKFSKRNPYVGNDEDLDLLTDKGVYPYDYFTSFDKFRDKQLPPKEKFYSNLTESNIEDDEYERAQKIWEHFGIRNLGQYHDLYLRTDVLLLTDVFENLRDLCLEYYGLDPAHYFTLPNFAWDAMLLKTVSY